MNEKGFSLIEMMVVMALMSILAVTMIPPSVGYLISARQNSLKQSARAIAQDLEVLLDASWTGAIVGDTNLDAHWTNSDIVENATIIEDYIARRRVPGGDGGIEVAGLDLRSPFDESLPLIVSAALGLDRTGQIYLGKVLDPDDNVVSINIVAMDGPASAGFTGKLLTLQVTHYE